MKNDEFSHCTFFLTKKTPQQTENETTTENSHDGQILEFIH